jgi:transcriptional regulator with XRE-family HTH domain
MATVPSVGDNIRTRRQQLGLSGGEAAARIGVPPSQLTNWERSRRLDLKLSSLFRVAKALETTVEQLCSGVDEEYETWKRSASEDADLLVAAWTRLSDKQKGLALALVDALLDRSATDRTETTPLPGEPQAVDAPDGDDETTK